MGIQRLRLLLPVLIAACVILKHVNAFETLVQAQGELRKDLPAKPVRFASPDWNIYHRTTNLHRLVANFSANCPSAQVIPKIAVPGESLSAGGASRPDRHIDPDLDDDQLPFGLSSASDGLLYLIIRFTKSTSTTSSARRFADGLLRRAHSQHITRVMFVFGEEGRDLLTSEIALRVLHDTCHHQPITLSSHHQQRPSEQRLSEGVELVLVPILNPDGRRISEMGRRCDRTNANDVDVDRNWPSFWGEQGTIPVDVHPQPDTTRNHAGFLRSAVARRVLNRGESSNHNSLSPGSHPFSEPETRALKAIVEKMQPASYVSVRTGAVALTVPWDCKPSLLADAQRARLLRVSESITAGHCTRCKTGNLWNVTGRVKCGTSTDYMFGNLRVPFVHTWHVYDMLAARGDCFRRHNPISQEAYDRVTQNWANAVFNFSNAVFNWMALENSDGLDVAEKNASLSAAKASAERAEALARGAPDPENNERDTSSFREPHPRIVMKLGTSQLKGKENRLPDRFWPFKIPGNNPKLAGSTASQGKIGPKLQERPISASEDHEWGILTGWWGVWTAFFMMGAGFYVAKRYVFKKRATRSRFLSHPAVKHA